jgi:hypothetical protein
VLIAKTSARAVLREISTSPVFGADRWLGRVGILLFLRTVCAYGLGFNERKSMLSSRSCSRLTVRRDLMRRMTTNFAAIRAPSSAISVGMQPVQQLARNMPIAFTPS